MFEQGIISAPVLAFYQVSNPAPPQTTINIVVQLADGDNVPDGVVSEVAIGGLDRNKYVGSMDWYHFTRCKLFEGH